MAIAMMTALVAAIFAYTILALAVSQGRQARFFRNRTSARYVAEAGLMVAQAHMTTDVTYANYCGETRWIDANGNGVSDPGESVVITVTPLCPRTAWTPVTIQVRASN